MFTQNKMEQAKLKDQVRAQCLSSTLKNKQDFEEETNGVLQDLNQIIEKMNENRNKILEKKRKMDCILKQTEEISKNYPFE